MRELMSYLGEQVHTLTVYDCTGTDEELSRLRDVLHGYGVALETAETDGEGPADVAVLHEDGSVLGATHVDPLLEWTDIGRAFDGDPAERPPLLSKVSTDVAVKPALTVEEMIRTSREFERRALREGSGEFHAGFQQLSQIKHSAQTVQMYTALAEKGVDVYVYGVPDVTLDDVPFTVIEDEQGKLDKHWFVLYDGDERKSALVSEECPTEDGQLIVGGSETSEQPASEYDSYVTTDPATVEALFELAKKESDILRL